MGFKSYYIYPNLKLKKKKKLWYNFVFFMRPILKKLRYRILIKSSKSSIYVLKLSKFLLAIDSTSSFSNLTSGSAIVL